MGNNSDSGSCDDFIEAFADDIVKKYRPPFLDKQFGDKVRYYVMGEGYPTWPVRLYAAINTGDGEDEEHFRVESSPEFCPPTDDFVSTVAEEFGLTEDEVRRRLGQSEQEDDETSDDKDDEYDAEESDE